MRAGGLSILAALVAFVALLSVQPAGSGAQTVPSRFPQPQPTQCPGTNLFAIAVVPSQCPPVITQPPTPTPAPLPMQTPRPAPILVPCGAGFVFAGQICLPQATPGPITPLLPQSTPAATPPPTRVPATATPQRPVSGTLPASVTISGQNPLTVTIHANQPLNFTHSVVIDVGPNTQATGVQVSAGTATIQGSQVIWNGFSLDTGQEASVTVSLAVTGGDVLTGTGPAAIQSISLEALDLGGSPLILQSDSSGALVSLPAPACNTGGGQSLIRCTGASEYSTPQFTVVGNWVLTWVFGPCPSGVGTFSLSVLNPDGSVSPSNPGLSESSAGDFGTQRYQNDGTYSVQALSVCPWNFEVQVQ